MSADSSGIFTTRGTSLRIRNIRLVLGPEGLVAPPITVELSVSMALFWLEIAWRHLVQADTNHSALLATGPDDAPRRGEALEGEFCAAMQAIVAAATALDAWYAEVKPVAKVPEAVAAAWKAHSTARYKQVAEVLRRAFCLRPQGVANLRRVLKDVYRFRNWAVHPPSEFSTPVLHPDLQLGTEWRYVAFAFSNAKPIVRAAIAFTVLLMSRAPGPSSEHFHKLCDNTLARLDPLIREWRARYGQLTDDEAFERRV